MSRPIDRYYAACDRLHRRGLTVHLAEDLKWVGPDVGDLLVAELEAASDEQLRELSRLDRVRRRAGVAPGS
jgi:hypothetical protein